LIEEGGKDNRADSVHIFAGERRDDLREARTFFSKSLALI
jgi:hypothetical protein